MRSVPLDLTGNSVPLERLLQKFDELDAHRIQGLQGLSAAVTSLLQRR
ncbi:hypothetical protein [Mesorhizobium sp. M0909]